MRSAVVKINNPVKLLEELQLISSSRLAKHKDESENSLPRHDESAKKQKLRIGFYFKVSKSNTLI